LQSATGIGSARLAQTSMGMSAGRSTRASSSIARRRRRCCRIKGIAIVLGFALPSLLLAGVAVGALPDLACVAALVVQAPGLIADRWLFFAQAKHPQNLYYQVVS
jgi:DMSO reductase anchor subunit